MVSAFLRGGPRQQIGHYALNGPYGVGYRVGDGRGQPDSLVDAGDLTTDHHGVRGSAAERIQAGEHGAGVHGVRIETRSTGKAFVVGFENMHRSRRSLVGNGVDKYQRLAAVEQVIGQVHTPDSVVHYLDARFGELLRDVADHLGAEAVVTEEDVADPGYQNSRRDCTTLTLTSGGSSCSGARPEC